MDRNLETATAHSLLDKRTPRWRLNDWFNIGNSTNRRINHTRGNLATGSDHKAKGCDDNNDMYEEADHEWVVGWNLVAMMQEDLEAANKLQRELVKERAYPDAGCMEDEVEYDAMWCLEALNKVLDVTAKNVRICAKLERWWNGDIKARWNTLGQDKRRCGRCLEGAAQVNEELRKSIQKSKSQMWSENWVNLHGGDVWRGAKYV